MFRYEAFASTAPVGKLDRTCCGPSQPYTQSSASVFQALSHQPIMNLLSMILQESLNCLIRIGAAQIRSAGWSSCICCRAFRKAFSNERSEDIRVLI